MKVESPTLRSPTYRSPTYRSPTYRSPAFRSNTFSLAPGEEAVCTLRFIEPPDASSGGEAAGQSGPSVMTAAQGSSFDPHEYAKFVAGSAVAQAANPDGSIFFASSLYIIDMDLFPASVNDVYAIQLEAFGGVPVTKDDRGTTDPGDDIHTYEGRWTPQTLLYATGEPSGLTVDVNGLVSGTPLFYPDVVYPQILSFLAEVTDLSTPVPLVARREFSITVACIFHPVAVTAGPFGDVCYGGATCVAGGVNGGSAVVSAIHGGSLTFTMVPYPCFDVGLVTVKRGGSVVSSGKTVQYTMADIRTDDCEIAASFMKIAYKVTAGTATTPPDAPGGTISPPGETLVECGASITFTIASGDGFLTTDVTDNGVSQGPRTTYTIANVQADTRSLPSSSRWKPG